MSLIAQKYGETSVGNLERIGVVAWGVRAGQAEGHRHVVVVSAMGHTTGDLLDMARSLHAGPR